MILDSCILIDLSRKNMNALDFLESVSVTPSISTVTVTEVLYGVKNTNEQVLFDQLFENWNVIPIGIEIARLASEYMQRFRASHKVDIVDALIAATAKQNNLELITLNLKHFPMFDGLERPY